MCTVPQDILEQLEETVQLCLDEGRMFTGYDITLETREREKTRISHRDVRGAIHEIESLQDAVEFGHDGPDGETVQWKKTQVMFNGQWVFVYHPEDQDPKTHKFRGSAPPAPAVKFPVTDDGHFGSGVPVAAAPIDDDNDVQNDSGGKNKDETYSLDYRNRLLVPTAYFRSINLSSGNAVFIVTDAIHNTIELSATAPPGALEDGQSLSYYQVERNGDLRLSSATLRQANLTQSKLKIETAGSVIRITA